MTEKVRAILVGTGSMGKVRAALMYANPRFDLCGIVDVDLAAGKELAGLYSAEAFSSLDEAIERFGVCAARPPKTEDQDNNDPGYSSGSSSCSAPSDTSTSISDSSSFPGLNAVVISTPTPTHSLYIEKAAKYGLSIFVEKPVADETGEIKRLFKICDRSRVPLCCGFQRRFDNSYVAVAEAVRSGKIGKALSATIFFGDHPCPPIEFLMSGGNIFTDLCVHDVDYIRWALEDEVDSVYADATYSRKELETCGVHDNATIVMKFKRGTLVTLTLSRWSCYGYDQRCEIFGEDGLVSVGSEHANTMVHSNRNGVVHSKLKHSFPERFEKAYGAELDAFADTVLSGMSWAVTQADVIAVHKVVEAAIQAYESKSIVYL